MKKEIDIITYKTINDCLAAFYGIDKKELSEVDGHFEWKDCNGREFTMEAQKAIQMIRKKKVWGWVEGKKTIHAFIRKSASLRDIIELLAHEVGHMQRPFYRSLKEEQKANIYEEVAVCAFDIATQLLESINA